MTWLEIKCDDGTVKSFDRDAIWRAEFHPSLDRPSAACLVLYPISGGSFIVHGEAANEIHKFLNMQPTGVYRGSMK